MLLSRAWGVLLPAGLLLAQGCGARTGLRQGHSEGSDAGADAAQDAADDVVSDAPLDGDAQEDAPPDALPDAPPDAPPACERDEQCSTGDRCAPARCSEGQCVAQPPVECDDGDECTLDACEPETGGCVHRPLTLDRDGDGHVAPRPGMAPGAPGACGDDCNDDDPLVFPGARELCDGLDNDCNGVVDDAARWVPVTTPPVRISAPTARQSMPGGLAHTGEGYVASYAVQGSHWRNLAKGLTATGATRLPETPITTTSGDSFSGPLVWTGAELATVWEDRRDADYEIYFNRLGTDAVKLGRDVRISSAQGFSLHPQIVWTGAEHLVFWDDHRDAVPQVMAQRVRPDGTRQGGNVSVVSDYTSESPVVALAGTRVGLAYMAARSDGTFVGFISANLQLGEVSRTALLSEAGAVTPAIASLGDRFLVAWATRSAVPGDAIWAAVVSQAGDVLVPARRVATGGTFARTPALLSLGDRALLLWADDRDGNYEIYSKLLSASLRELSARARVTRDPADSYQPVPAMGAGGDIGLLFADRRSGSWQTYFTRLECQAGR